MTEILRYAPICKQDLAIGTGTKEIRLGDGRVVSLDEIRLTDFLSALTTGSVLFVKAGGVAGEDASNLFWDDTNNRLGIGTIIPAQAVDVIGRIAASIAAIAPSAGPSASQQHTLPAVASDTVVLLAAVQTLTNKTLTSPTVDGPTIQGTVAAGTGLTMPTFNLENADTTLSRSAAGIPAAEGVALVTVSATQTLTNKTLTSPVINTPTGDIIGKSFTSANQTITAGGQLILAHGLGEMPKIIQVRLKNTTGEVGYAVGDEVIVNPHTSDAGESRGCAIVPDGTNLTIRYGSGASTFQILAKDTGNGSAITNGSWAAIFRAWA